jgi:hypothetical protein
MVYDAQSYWGSEQWLRLTFSKGQNRGGVFFPTREDGNRFGFQNIAFSGF